jgi:hypothetical protein
MDPYRGGSPLTKTHNTNVQTEFMDKMKSDCMEGKIKLCDAMGGAFLNIRTYCQLHGANVCFTDMDHIVRHRVTQFPGSFNMTHFWNAMQLMCLDAKTVARMTPENGEDILLDIYRTALTSEIMDSKQSEYYTDYGVYAIQDATTDEMKYNTQPDPTTLLDADACTAGEMWFYKTITGAADIPFKFRMRPTDDQKQVCTAGEKLYNRFISDDCETSASFILGVHRTFMAIRAYMVRMNLWNDTSTMIDTSFYSKNIPPEVINKICGSDDTGYNKHDFVKALANILRHYKLDVELCIGSASSASIGSDTGASGHCFAMLNACCRTSSAPTPKSFILEGTNWIAQKSVMGVYGDVDDDFHTKITQISTILMEATKEIDGNFKFAAGLDKDHGKALALVKVSTVSPTPFI